MKQIWQSLLIVMAVTLLIIGFLPDPDRNNLISITLVKIL